MMRITTLRGHVRFICYPRVHTQWFLATIYPRGYARVGRGARWDMCIVVVVPTHRWVRGGVGAATVTCNVAVWWLVVRGVVPGRCVHTPGGT